MRGVLYGAIYSTLLTQRLKTLIILVMNLAFRVPLAAVLAIVSFIIGFFPIVGSWSVYVPVAAWLLVFRDSPGATGPWCRGRLSPEPSSSRCTCGPRSPQSGRGPELLLDVRRPDDGVYTFGLAGILIGPILIGLLKAIVDSVTSPTNWRCSTSRTVEGGESGRPAVEQ